MVAQMLQRRGLASEWSTVNPVLADGELGIDKTNNAIKVGDGVTPWNNLKFSYVLASKATTKGDLIVGTGTGTADRLPAGTPGQTLSVDGAGNLVWIDKNSTADYVQSGYADATYETIAESAAAHALMISSVDMASTYETVADSNTTHALLETFTHAASTYAPLASADSTYAKKVLLARIASGGYTTVNSTALQYGASGTGKVAVEINSTYLVDMVIFYTAPVSSGIDVTLFGPLNSTANLGVHAAPSGSLSSGGQFATSFLNIVPFIGTSGISGRISLGAAGPTAPLFLTVKGIVKTGSFAAGTGYIGFGFSQTVATNDEGVNIIPPTYIRAEKVA